MRKDALWTKDFCRITAATALGAAGGILSGFALSFLVFDETGSTLAAAVIVAIQLFPYVILPLFLAPLMDRLPRKPFLVGGDIVNGLLYGLAGLYLLRCEFSYGAYLGFSLLLACLGSFDQLAYESFYPLVLPKGQEEKGYTVSSMLYRMKRNGAGLASICILSTMVLVMISSSGCLYIGKENILRRQYPRDMQLAVWDGEEEHLDLLQSISEEYMQRHGFTMKDAWRYRYLSVAALADGDRLAFQRAGVSAGSLGDVSDLRNLLVIPLSDYNRATGKDETLPEGEILIGVNRGQEYPYETMKIGNLDTWKVKKTVPQPFDNKVASYEINTTYFLIVPDMDSVYQVEKEEKKVYGDYASDVRGYFGFNVDCSDEQQIKIEEGISLAISKKWMDMDIAYSTECIADDRSYFFGTFSGLFALGIILGSVFILAMILIMYYKQITEGYEDQSRFEVMQKVGMTKREIRRSINSQMLTVFILPPAMAGLHLTFAFPFLSKILMLFGLSDQSFLIRIAVGCFGVFTVFYILVYLFTSRAYYRIVSGN